MPTSIDKEKIKKEFKEKFAINVIADNDKDYMKAFILEKFWQEDTLDTMAEFIISRFESELEEKVKEIEGLVPYDENAEQENSGAYEYHAQKELLQKVLSKFKNNK